MAPLRPFKADVPDQSGVCVEVRRIPAFITGHQGNGVERAQIAELVSGPR
jgi:hypothetical protein